MKAEKEMARGHDDDPVNDVILSTVEYRDESIEEMNDDKKQTRPDRVKITTKENALAFFTFVVMGTAAMAFWNTLIGCLYSIQTFVYPDQKDISDTITAVYTTMSLIVTATLIRFQILNTKFLMVGAAGFVISSLGIALTCQVAPGLTGVIIFHLISALGGSCTAFFESSMFGFASVLPRNYVGAASLGLGVSGLLSFVGWILCSKVIFPMSVSGVKSAVWLYLSCTAGVNILAMILFLMIYRRPWAIRSARIAEAQRREKEAAKHQTTLNETSALESQPRDKSKQLRTRWNVFKDASEQILNVSFTLWLTLMMFPNIAPFAWGRSVTETDLLMGIWQCGDFFGRYIPNLRAYIPFAVVKPKTVKYFTVSRLLFIPIFMVIYRLPDDQLGILGTFWFQAICMFIFVFMSGWICSLSSMYVPDCVEDADEKGQAATMYLLCLLLGLSIGVWMSKLWKL